MRLLTLILSIIVGIPMLVSAQETSRCAGQTMAYEGQTLTSVSIYQLVATPTAYDGCRISVTGFVNLEFEGTAVYPHRDDFLHGLNRNGLWLDFFGSDREAMRTDSTINGNYASVVGTFDADSHGHMGLWSGSITQIESIMTWSMIEDPRRIRFQREREKRLHKQGH